MLEQQVHAQQLQEKKPPKINGLHLVDTQVIHPLGGWFAVLREHWNQHASPPASAAAAAAAAVASERNSKKTAKPANL